MHDAFPCLELQSFAGIPQGFSLLILQSPLAHNFGIGYTDEAIKVLRSCTQHDSQKPSLWLNSRLSKTGLKVP